MGLDWIPLPKAKPGHESEVARLRSQVQSEDVEDDLAERLEERLGEITIAPEDTIGVPRVGVDAAATAWLREQWEREHATAEPRNPPTRTWIADEELGEVEVIEEDERVDWSRPFEAVEWLRFWGSRGHGFFAWY